MAISGPVGFIDLSEWLAFVTVVLLLTAEIVSHFGPAQGLLVDKTRLRLLAVTTGVLLLMIVALRALQIVGV